jgi:hypothetical protein
MTSKTVESINELMEKLASIEHERWADWQKYVFSKCEVLIDGSTMIPKWAVEQWTRQIHTPYEQLNEKEKESDRKEVRRYLPLIHSQYQQLVKECVEDDEDYPCKGKCICKICEVIAFKNQLRHRIRSKLKEAGFDLS